MSRSRAILPAGVAAALLANFWLLEDWLAERTDLSGSWISDLAARTQVYGWRFQLLEVASGLAVAGYAALLLRATGAWGRASERGDGESARLLRRGLLALLAAGILVAIGGAAPLNCAEALERACDLSYDPFDLVHSAANLFEIAAVAIAFASVGLALLRTPQTRRLGQATLAIGAAWLLLTACSGLSYPFDSIDSVKGLCQRGAQVLLGTWLLVLTRL
ncbi:MAG: hypothetical protein ABW065_01540 [Solirubrobacterales bacterium]